MADMDLSGQARDAIRRYRSAEWHQVHRGLCRCRPTCSVYAERALDQHRLPVALALVALRVMRCNPLMATRRDRRRSVGVLALAALTTLLVSWPSAALAAPRTGGSQTDGGCFALVGGRPIGDLTKDHPLQVGKGQQVVIEGQAPTGVAGAASKDGVIIATINFVDGIASYDDSDSTHGAHFSKSVDVATYLKYGSGLYKVDVSAAAAGGWDCKATFYAEMNGSKIAAELAAAAGAVGVVGATLASRGDAPDPPVESPSQDPSSGSPQDYDDVYRQNRILGLEYDTALGCLIATVALITKGVSMAIPPVLPGKGTVWVRGHAVLGLLSGILAGVGVAVAGQQYGQWTLNVRTAIVLPAVIAVLCSVRAWLGRPWQLRSARS